MLEPAQQDQCPSPGLSVVSTLAPHRGPSLVPFPVVEAGCPTKEDHWESVLAPWVAWGGGEVLAPAQLLGLRAQAPSGWVPTLLCLPLIWLRPQGPGLTPPQVLGDRFVLS